MYLNLSKLNEKQKKEIQDMYNGFLEENKKFKQSKKRVSSKIDISFLKEKLFNERNPDGDIYMDIDTVKYGFGVSFNEDTGDIENHRDNTILGKFTPDDFLPCCDHLSEEILDELEDQVSYCTGGNYMRWSDLHKETENVPNHLLGYHTLENGFTFYGMYGTNDCVWPVYFILYYDGEKIRGYVPQKGNQFCLETKEAWGQECSFFDSYEESEEFEETLMKKLENYTYFNYEEIKENILQKIKVKNK